MDIGFHEFAHGNDDKRWRRQCPPHIGKHFLKHRDDKHQNDRNNADGNHHGHNRIGHGPFDLALQLGRFFHVGRQSP